MNKYEEAIEKELNKWIKETIKLESECHKLKLQRNGLITAYTTSIVVAAIVFIAELIR